MVDQHGRTPVIDFQSILRVVRFVVSEFCICVPVRRLFAYLLHEVTIVTIKHLPEESIPTSVAS